MNKTKLQTLLDAFIEALTPHDPTLKDVRFNVFWDEVLLHYNTELRLADGTTRSISGIQSLDITVENPSWVNYPPAYIP